MERNYCTGLPDIFASAINHCCKAHDDAYVLHIDKIQADLDFYSCVELATNPIWAIVLTVIACIGGYYYWYRRSLKKHE